MSGGRPSNSGQLDLARFCCFFNCKWNVTSALLSGRGCVWRPLHLLLPVTLTCW